MVYVVMLEYNIEIITLNAIQFKIQFQVPDSVPDLLN